MRLQVVARAGLTGWCAAVIAVHTRGVVTSENNNVYPLLRCLTAVCEPRRRVATKDVCRMNVLGIWLYEGATGVIKGCNLTFNTKSPLKLEKDAGRVEVAKDNKLRDKDA